MVKEDVSELVELMQEQIRATNRVNHAVRAIVIPSTILLISILIASPFLALGWVFDAGAFYTLAGLSLFIGAVIAIISQVSESGASEMDEDLVTGQIGAAGGQTKRAQRIPMVFWRTMVAILFVVVGVSIMLLITRLG